jgi:hypothetical protein
MPTDNVRSLPTNRPTGIRYTDRVFVGGVTGSGKSVLINHLSTAYRCQRFVYDTKDEFTIPGVEPVHHLERIDWTQPVIHYIDDDGDLRQTNRLFKTLWDRKVGRSGLHYGLVVIVHELGDLCADQPGATPQWVSNYIRKGRAHGLGLLAGGQRPRNIPRIARTECTHVFSFASGFDPEDLPVMAQMHRMTIPEYERALAKAAQLGEHAYIWGDRRARVNVIRPPLTSSMMANTLAEGIDPSTRRTPGELPEPEGDLRETSGNAAGDLPETLES